MKRVIFILAVMMLAACRKDAPPPGGPQPPGSGFDERQGCSVDADCVAVEIACCDHCNGGTVVGIHRDHAAEVRKTYAPDSKCHDVACTEMACVEQPAPICRQGICGLRIGDKEDVPALPPP